jgi:hypothetical protein
MNFMFCILCGQITDFVVEIPVTFSISLCHKIYCDIRVSVLMGTIVSDKKVYILYLPELKMTLI